MIQSMRGAILQRTPTAVKCSMRRQLETKASSARRVGAGLAAARCPEVYEALMSLIAGPGKAEPEPADCALFKQIRGGNGSEPQSWYWSCLNGVLPI